MSVAWVRPNCPSAQQRVFIRCWPLARDAHSDCCPLVQRSKTIQSCRAPSESHCQTPGGGVFSDKSVPNLVPALNYLFVISSMWMSVWPSCGSMDCLCSDTLHGFHQDLASAARLPFNFNPSSSHRCCPIKLSLFFSPSHEAWNTSFYIGIGRYLNFWSDPGCAH